MARDRRLAKPATPRIVDSPPPRPARHAERHHPTTTDHPRDGHGQGAVTVATGPETGRKAQTASAPGGSREPPPRPPPRPQNACSEVLRASVEPGVAASVVLSRCFRSGRAARVAPDAGPGRRVADSPLAARPPPPQRERTRPAARRRGEFLLRAALRAALPGMRFLPGPRHLKNSTRLLPDRRSSPVLVRPGQLGQAPRPAPQAHPTAPPRPDLLSDWRFACRVTSRPSPN